MKISAFLLHLVAFTVIILAGIAAMVANESYDQASKNLVWPLLISGTLGALVFYALGDGLDLLAENAASNARSAEATERTAAALEQLAARGRQPTPADAGDQPPTRPIRRLREQR